MHVSLVLADIDALIRWLFIIEGSITIGIAILAIFTLPDYPYNARFLTPEERLLCVARIENDGGEAIEHDKSVFYGIKEVVKDPLLWLFSLMMCCYINGVGISFLLSSYVGIFMMRSWGLTVSTHSRSLRSLPSFPPSPRPLDSTPPPVSVSSSIRSYDHH